MHAVLYFFAYQLCPNFTEWLYLLTMALYKHRHAEKEIHFQ